MRFTIIVLLLLQGCAACTSLDAQPPGYATDLSGFWRLDASLSEDPERLLEERLEKERRLLSSERRREEMMRPPGEPPAIDAQVRQRPWQKRREEQFRRMLNITETLRIEQQGSRIELASAAETRRVTAGERSQVSMPQGGLADSKVGWDGEWLVIDRSVRDGPRVVERFRLLKNGRLEYRMAWSGDTELSGLSVRRIFHRSTPAPNPDPAVGPIR